MRTRTLKQGALWLWVCLCFWSPFFASAADFPLTAFPQYRQSTWAATCLQRNIATFSTALGCSDNPATCLCTNEAQSLSIARAVRICITRGGLPVSATTFATEFWASYCRTNAGVIATDEILFENIGLITRMGDYLSSCLTRVSAMMITTLGCDNWTKAPCLCSSSAAVNARFEDECVVNWDSRMKDNGKSGSVLFQSYCEANSKAPAARTITDPIAVTGEFSKQSRGDATDTNT